MAATGRPPAESGTRCDEHTSQETHQIHDPLTLLVSCNQADHNDTTSARRLARLLGVALLLAASNTALLSFALHSMGPAGSAWFWSDGEGANVVAWEARSGRLELAAQVAPGKSVSLRSIVAGANKPDTAAGLRLVKWPASSGRDKAAPDLLAATSGSNYLAIDAPQQGPRHRHHRYQQQQPPPPPPLQLASERLLLEVIRANASAKRQPTTAKASPSGLLLDVWQPSRAAAEAGLGAQPYVSLPLERRLALRSSARPASGSPLAVEGWLESGQQIAGALGENLDVQTRRGRLECSAGDRLRLVSRSAGARLTAFQSVRLRAQRIVLDARRLLLASGVAYFDALPASEPAPEPSQASVPVAGRPPETPFGPDDEPAPDASPPPVQLLAHNLMASVSGLLMAGL